MMMWTLACDAWAVAGWPIPDYERGNAPIRIVRRAGRNDLGRSDLLRNKREAGRSKDLLDIELLVEAEGNEPRQNS